MPGGHDIVIEQVDGLVKKGFMFPRDENGLRGFSLRDAQSIAPRTLTEGELIEADFPAEHALFWYQENWRGGMGGQLHRRDTAKMALIVGADSTVTGKLRPAGINATTTVDTNPNNREVRGFATVGTEVWSFMGRDVYKWNYTDKDWDIGTEPLADNVIYRNGLEFGATTVAPGWDTDKSNRPSPYIHKADADADWTLAAFTAAAPNVMCKHIGITRNVIGAELFVGAGWRNYVDSGSDLDDGTDINSTDTAITYDQVTSNFAVGDVIAMDDELMEVTATPSSTTLTVVRALYGTTGATHLNNVNIFDLNYDKNTSGGRHQIRTTTDPTSISSWTSAISIGQFDAPINAVLEHQDQLIVAKSSGVFGYFQDGTDRNLTPEMQANAHPDNFKGAFNWQGRVLLPLGVGGMLELTPEGIIEDISLALYMPDQTAFHGRVAAITGEPTRVFLTILNTVDTQYELLMGEWAEIDGVADYRWMKLTSVPYIGSTDADYSVLFSEGIPSGANAHRRVWVGWDQGTGVFFPVFVPLEGDVEHLFNAAVTEGNTTDFDANLPRVNKTFASIDVESANLGTAGRQITVKYTIDAASEKTLGVVDISPLQTIHFPEGTIGKVLSLSFEFSQSANATTAPELLSFRVTCQLRPDALKTMPVQFYLADGQMTLSGALSTSSGSDLTQLRKWNDGAAEVHVTDPTGLVRDMVFLPGMMSVREVRHENGRRPEYIVSALLAEV